MIVTPASPSPSSPNDAVMLAAKARDAVEAEVMPEHITGEGDEEGEEMHAEGAVSIERRAGGARIFSDELEIAEGRHQRDGEGDQERQPHRAPDLIGDLPGQRVDAGSKDVADDEE